MSLIEITSMCKAWNATRSEWSLTETIVSLYCGDVLWSRHKSITTEMGFFLEENSDPAIDLKSLSGKVIPLILYIPLRPQMSDLMSDDARQHLLQIQIAFKLNMSSCLTTILLREDSNKQLPSDAFSCTICTATLPQQWYHSCCLIYIF